MPTVNPEGFPYPTPVCNPDGTPIGGGGGGGGGADITTGAGPIDAETTRVVLASDQPTVPVNQPGVSATGNITATNGFVALTLNGAAGVAIDIRGAFSASLTFQASVDGVNFFQVQATPFGGAQQQGTIATVAAGGAWQAPCAGCVAFRVFGTIVSSGSAAITLRAVNAAPWVLASLTGGTAVAVSGTVTANIGSGSQAAGTNLIGDVGIQVRANATGAASIRHVVSGASTGAANVKASAGRVLGWSFGNTTASWRYVKLHNTAGTPTAGAGVVMTIAIPPNGINASDLAAGVGFATGIGITHVTGAADADTTATAANDIVGDLFFA